ncbi:MAG: glycine oxidase ThiO [Planctomycetota bacterium]
MSFNTLHSERDCLILGGGIIGLSIAWELSKLGKQVCILEAAEIASGQPGASSWAGAGILPASPQKNVVDPLDALKALSHGLLHDWALELSAQTSIDIGYRQCGGIHLALSPAELATLVAQEMWWNEHGILYERLDAEQLQQVEPGLFQIPKKNATSRADILAGWLLPEEAQIRNPDLLKALKMACNNSGVQLVEHCSIQNLQTDDDGTVLGAQAADGTVWNAKHFCLCAGAWTKRLIEQFECPNGLMPIRGQMLLYEFASPPIRHVINEGNRYIVPRDSGHVLCGSVEEEVGFKVADNPRALQEIRTWAESVLPRLQAEEPCRTWCGLRPGSFDGLPYLGPVPEHKNLSIASGHFRSGIHLAPATAACMAHHICGPSAENGTAKLKAAGQMIDLHPFRLARG